MNSLAVPSLGKLPKHQLIEIVGLFNTRYMPEESRVI